MNFKDIHIGSLVKLKVEESETELSRICNFMDCSDEEIRQMYQSQNLSTKVLLRWSKLLEYDFFRVYSQHLILYAPASGEDTKTNQKSKLPRFRKNIYTREVIDFIVEQIQTKEMSKTEVMNRYRIPKSTLYKWIDKYEK